MKNLTFLQIGENINNKKSIQITDATYLIVSKNKNDKVRHLSFQT